MTQSKNNYHVHHILVKHQYEAEDLLKKLGQGAEFSELAKKFSICPSSSVGGDLGPQKFGRADSDFEEAVSILKIGSYTEKPIRTRFGYHLIFRKN